MNIQTNNPMITKDDIDAVAEDFGLLLSPEQNNWVLKCYEDAQRQDPTANWRLVVEDLIHQLLEF